MRKEPVGAGKPVLLLTDGWFGYNLHILRFYSRSGGNLCPTSDDLDLNIIKSIIRRT